MRPILQIRGFTLIESLVAIAILTVAIVGPMTVANSAIVASRIARDQLTASYLAQEGVEYLRAVRDNEYLASLDSVAGWDNFLIVIALCHTPALCTLDPQSITPLVAYTTSVPPLYLSGGRYTQMSDPLADHRFTRTVQVLDAAIDNVGRVTDMRVVSKVSWLYQGSPYAITITDHFTPWQ